MVEPFSIPLLFRQGDPLLAVPVQWLFSFQIVLGYILEFMPDRSDRVEIKG